VIQSSLSECSKNAILQNVQEVATVSKKSALHHSGLLVAGSCFRYCRHFLNAATNAATKEFKQHWKGDDSIENNSPALAKLIFL